MNAMKSFGFIFLDSTVCTLDVMVHTYGQLPNELVDKHIMQILSDLLCFMNLFSHVERTPFVILIFHSTQKNIPTLKSYNIFCWCKKLFYPSKEVFKSNYYQACAKHVKKSASQKHLVFENLNNTKWVLSRSMSARKVKCNRHFAINRPDKTINRP